MMRPSRTAGWLIPWRHVSVALKPGLIAGLAALFGAGTSSAQQEPVGPNTEPIDVLPRDALVAWFDATRLNTARASLGLAEVADGEPINLWPDRSPRARHLLQRRQTARPRWLTQGPLPAAVRFDGRDDVLESIQPGSTNDALSIVLVLQTEWPREDRASTGSRQTLLATHRFAETKTPPNLDLQWIPEPEFTPPTAADTPPDGRFALSFANLNEIQIPRSQQDSNHQLSNAFAILEAEIDTRENRFALRLGGQAVSTRIQDEDADQAPDLKPLVLDVLTLGASRPIGQDPATENRPFAGSIAECLVFDRALTDDERDRLQRYLTRKYPADGEASTLGASRPIAWEPVRDRGPVHLVEPGFRQRSLPIIPQAPRALTYHKNGYLFVLSRSGTVSLIRDRNGDGLEDQLTLFATIENFGDVSGPFRLRSETAGPDDAVTVRVMTGSGTWILSDTDGDLIADAIRRRADVSALLAPPSRVRLEFSKPRDDDPLARSVVPFLERGPDGSSLWQRQTIPTPTGLLNVIRPWAFCSRPVLGFCQGPDGSVRVALGGEDHMDRQNALLIALDRIDDPEGTWPLRCIRIDHQHIRIDFNRPLDRSALQALSQPETLTLIHGQRLQPGERYRGSASDFLRFAKPITHIDVMPDRRRCILEIEDAWDRNHNAILRINNENLSASRSDETNPDPWIECPVAIPGARIELQLADGSRHRALWPHPSPTITQALLDPRIERTLPPALFLQPGRLRVLTTLDLDTVRSRTLARLKAQGRLEADTPPGNLTYQFRSGRPLTVECPEAQLQFASTRSDGTSEIALQFDPDRTEPVPIQIEGATTDQPWRLHASVSSPDLDGEAPLPPSAFRYGPVEGDAEPLLSTNAEIYHQQQNAMARDLGDGDPVAGMLRFHGDRLACAECHRRNGRGGVVGPPLDETQRRGPEELLFDIHSPDARLDPTHASHAVTLADGRQLHATIREQNDRVRLGLADGSTWYVPASDIERVEPAPGSLMPSDLGARLDAQMTADLIAYLQQSPVPSAPISRDDPPAPRTQPEIENALGTFDELADQWERLPNESTNQMNVVLVAGPKDSGPDEHDYPLWQQRWALLLKSAPDIDVSLAELWPNQQQWEQADVIMMYCSNARWTAEKSQQVARYLLRGGGLIVLHYALNGQDDVPRWSSITGLAWDQRVSRVRRGPVTIQPTETAHPILDGFDAKRPIAFRDAAYWNLWGDPNRVEVLARARVDDREVPALWVREEAKGRIVATTLGYYIWTFDDPLFRAWILRAIAWSARREPDRYLPLALPGSRWSTAADQEPITNPN